MDGEAHISKLVTKPRRWEIVTGFCLINGFKRGAELGVSTGRFTNYLCSMIPDLHMVAVDLWSEQPRRDVHNAETYTGWDHNGNYEAFCAHVAKYYASRVKIIRSDTSSAAVHVEDSSLDFVFIDADHTYEGCLKDIEAWTPKVRKGGLICGHDFEWNGVLRAVTETGKVDFVATDNVWGRFVR